jgi:hypothetical protein
MWRFGIERVAELLERRANVDGSSRRNDPFRVLLRARGRNRIGPHLAA